MIKPPFGYIIACTNCQVRMVVTDRKQVICPDCQTDTEDDWPITEVRG